jgi:MFS family permease
MPGFKLNNWLPGLTDGRIKQALVVLSVSQIVSWGAIYYSFSLFIEPIHLDYGWTYSQITGAMTLSLLAWATCAPVISTYLEKGKGKQVMTVGSLVGSLGFFMWALLPGHILVFYLAWVVIDISMSMTLYTNAFTILTQQFPGSYKQAITLLTLAGGFAGTIFYPLIQLCIETVGWQRSIYFLVFVNLLITAPLHFFGIPKHKKPAPHSTSSFSLIDLTLFADKRFNPQYFWGLLLWFISYNATSTSITFLFIPVFSALDLEMSVIILAMALTGPMQITGRILYMFAASTVSIQKISILIGAVMVTTTSLLITLPAHPITLYLFIFLFGIVKGIMTIIKGTAVTELMGVSLYARTNGWLSSGYTLAGALTPFFVGFIWYSTGKPYSVLITCWFTSLVMIPGIFMIRKELKKSTKK